MNKHHRGVDPTSLTDGCVEQQYCCNTLIDRGQERQFHDTQTGSTNTNSAPIADREFPAGVVWEPLEADAFTALTSLISRIETTDNPPYRTSTQEVQDRLTADTFWMGIAGWTNANGDMHASGYDREMIAFATVAHRRGRGNEVICRGGVDPSFRNRGIGTFLVDWQTTVGHQELFYASRSTNGQQESVSRNDEDGFMRAKFDAQMSNRSYLPEKDGEKSHRIDTNFGDGEPDQKRMDSNYHQSKDELAYSAQNTYHAPAISTPRHIITQVDGENSTLIEHLQSLGYMRAQTYLDLRASLTNQLPQINDLGPHLKITPWEDSMLGLILRASHQPDDEEWGSSLPTQEQWHEEHSAFVPEWSFLVLSTKTDRSQVAGFVLASRYEQDWEALGGSEGYIDRMSVFEAWRYDHVADALIHASMQAQKDSQIDYAATGLSERNNSDLVTVYERLGFQVVGKSYLYALDA